MRRCGKQTSSLIVLHRPSHSLTLSELPLLSPSVCCCSPALLLSKLLALAFLAIALRFAPAIALRAVLLAFTIAARVTVACLRYRPSYCRCLQCRCTRSKSLPTSRPSSLLCRTGLWRATRSPPNRAKGGMPHAPLGTVTATIDQMLHATPFFVYMTTAPSVSVLYTLLQKSVL